MEYRGYDSAGVATLSDDQIVVKQAGKVDDVNKANARGAKIIGIFDKP